MQLIEESYFFFNWVIRCKKTEFEEILHRSFAVSEIRTNNKPQIRKIQKSEPPNRLTLNFSCHNFQTDFLKIKHGSDSELKALKTDHS